MRVSRFVVAAALLTSACSVSRTHLGFHNFGDGKLGFSVVGKKYVAHLREREDRWMRSLARLDLDALAADFTPALASEFDAGALAKLAKQIERDYRPTGEFERRIFGTPSFATSKGVRRDAFAYYDMIGFAYLMEGRVMGAVQFYATRVDGSVKLCGFEIVPVRESDRETAKEVRFVRPESLDRAKMAGHADLIERR